ncbi:MAG TPA: sugar phosphate nucleotidyltransferase [Micromonosporaceae bacterium]
MICAVVLCAGEGIRLRPITAVLPKPLCPVGNVALLDRALRRLTEHALVGPQRVAVNTCYLGEQVARHVDGRAHISREPGPPALGTSGALHHLRDWIAGRDVLVLNSDAYLSGSGRDLRPLLDGWDRRTVRVLSVPTGDRAPEFGDRRFAGASLLPADLVADLPAGRSDLVLTLWRPAQRAGRLELAAYDGLYLDTGTPADYLAANLHAAAAAPLGSLIDPDAVVTGRVDHCVVGAGAHVAGSVTRCVVLPGARVARAEVLADVIRLGTDTTVSGPATARYGQRDEVGPARGPAPEEEP